MKQGLRSWRLREITHCRASVLRSQGIVPYGPTQNPFEEFLGTLQRKVASNIPQNDGCGAVKSGLWWIASRCEM